LLTYILDIRRFNFTTLRPILNIKNHSYLFIYDRKRMKNQYNNKFKLKLSSFKK